MVPSDLSDFNLYGGIYRYLNLVYLPEVSVASLKIVPTLDTKMKKPVWIYLDCFIIRQIYAKLQLRFL